MRRFAVWGLTSALAAGLAAPVFADGSPSSSSWYSRVLGSKSESDKAPAAKTFADLPTKPVAYAPLDPETVMQATQAEWAAWHRRLEVCHKLREIAVQKNDDQLYTQADDLEKQATALLRQRIARLGVKLPPDAQVNEPARAFVSSPSDLAPKPKSLPTPASNFREVQP